MSSCHSYGSASGCDINCPFLWDGECDIVEDVLGDESISEEDRAYLREIYNLEEQ